MQAKMHYEMGFLNKASLLVKAWLPDKWSNSGLTGLSDYTIIVINCVLN